MDHLCVIMRIIERVTELSDPAGELIRFEDLLFLSSSQIRERFAVDVLHRNATGALVMDEVVNPNDVRMRQFEGSLRLMFKLIQQRTILDHQVGKKFKRNIPFQFFIARQPYNPHSASTEHLDQLVAAK